IVQTVKDALDKTGGTVVVSNGCDAEIKHQLQTLESQSDGRFCFIEHAENNLAAAQNAGIEYARQQHYRFILLLDDDSQPEEDMVAQLVHAYNMAADKPSIGLVAAHMQEMASEREIRYVKPKFGLFFSRHSIAEHEVLDGVQQVIASGSLVPIAVINAVGHMDESYVIDYVDKEFCMRLNSQGYRILVVGNATLHHRIGQSQDHQMLGGSITTTNHGAYRRYYIARNRMRTMLRYGLRSPSFFNYELLSLGYELFRVIGFESQRGPKLVAMARGIWDALCGVSGYARYAAYKHNTASPVKDHG
ncbi:MAG: glycosyltransferase, partial [Rickettsiales bacterium]|nr:glycosyltransferase [Rickettsiales bacterium]